MIYVHKIYSTYNDPIADIAFFDSFHSVLGLDTVKLAKIEESSEEDSAFAFRPDSEFRELFDYHLNKLKGTGLLARIEARWLKYVWIIISLT